MSKKLKKLFTDRDLDRYKTHEKGYYPPESTYEPKSKITKYKKKIYAAPTVINLEMTEACNVKCRHCYNPWRDEHAGKFNLDEKKIDYLIEEFVKNKVFHVILSGGEPLSKFKDLCYALEKLVTNNISTSLNSNLMLATPEKMKKLKDIGLDHVLTSWFSYFPIETDYITKYKGSYQKIIDGIKTTVNAGIRVSANTIVTQHNKDTIYKSGKFLHSIGVTQFFAHRVIPPAYDRKDKESQHYVTIKEAKKSLDELLKLKKEFGMSVGTLINYPLCMIGDLEKYQDFVGRGCPTQQGHRFNINSNGETHGCVMEDKNYGNVYEVGLKEVYEKTMKWRNESYLYEGCKGCHYIDVCQSGCRMDAYSASGKMDGKDPLMPGKEFIVKPFKFKNSSKVKNSVLKNVDIYVPKTIRFRKENSFWLMNIRWANSIEITNEEGEFFLKMQKSSGKFNHEDFKDIGSVDRLVGLICKEALKSDKINISIRKTGVNIDPLKLPDLNDESFLENHPNINN
jgi:radical SAM protein with 4Fe4S-binding SPASM domain